MSLINEMLRDLDARHAADSERAALGQQVRALPSAPQRRWHLLLMPLLAAAAAGGGVWWWLQPDTTVAPPPVAALPPALPLPPVSVPMSAPAPTEPSPATGPDTRPGALRLDTVIAAVPAPTSTAVAPLAKAPESKPVESKIAAPRPVAEPKPVPLPKLALPPAPSATASLQPQISKQPSLGGRSNAAEQAENEYRRGYNAVRQGNVNEASEAFRSALRAYPGHANARQALLALLVEQKDWQAAEVLALDGAGVSPERNDWAMLAARIMLEQGEAAQALETMARFAPNARRNPDYQVFHALLLQRANRHAEAVNCYQTALELRPAEGRWWYGLGHALDADHREKEARQAYEKARDSGNLPTELLQNIERRLR